MAYFYVALTVLLTVYCQIVIKWQAVSAGVFPVTAIEKILFLLRLLLNPWIMSGFLSAFFAAMAWMAAMTELPLSHAYPLLTVTFVLVVLAGVYIFNEPLTWFKIAGMVLIVSGVIVGSQG